ncbi:glycosyltransferase family 4 protein [Segetibacter koreensis]|uniref:glycosyltransferase family 4 protein n=1 Tax=Segetibacter koreensis TaxID=398037 RepID=UPI000373BD2B|nr:glycosyltransferase family 1 protein [Segetibacter koreensis]
MKIAFDAKRAYQNATGLGHYSRTLISSLASFYSSEDYYLCAPKVTNRFATERFKNVENITPGDFLSKKFKSAWRSSWVKKDLKKRGIDIYHGLSNEIPFRIQNTSVRSVVTIHDLIFERYPQQYNWLDVQIYRQKFKYACRNADQIIAISQQTKEDIIDLYKIPEYKITVCYQSCEPRFAKTISEMDKLRIKEIYELPDCFFLYVGSMIERKNLLNICKALHELKGKLEIPLVVIGSGGAYKQKVKEYLRKYEIDKKVLFLSETDQAKISVNFQSSTDFPAIYQLSSGLIYPSVFEGFGLPVLEALWSRVPVITSNISCLPETGGDAAYYVDPHSPSQIAEGMLQLATNTTLVKEMQEKGWKHAQNFTAQKCAAEVMEVYLRM